MSSIELLDPSPGGLNGGRLGDSQSLDRGLEAAVGALSLGPAPGGSLPRPQRYNGKILKVSHAQSFLWPLAPNSCACPIPSFV